jgi:hypothetical protein
MKKVLLVLILGSMPERLLEINHEDLALWRRLVREAGIPLE